jgi:hypothetical protein
MTKKTKKADAAQADATTTNEATNETPIEATVETQPETAVATEPPPEAEPPKPKKVKGKKKASTPTGNATLADIAAGYLAHMEEAGKSDGTISSYRMELKTAAAELGEDTPIADITPEKVQAFFDSKRVTKLRSGKNKSQLSIDKTRRVLRLALVWAEERGIVAKAPLPEPANA